MAKRQPALSTQLKAAQARVEELEKKLKQSEDMKSHFSKREDEKTMELEGLHALLDVMPGAPARKQPRSDGYGDTSLTCAVRLAGYFASIAAKVAA